jgi:type I restriction enzyme R subunit
MLTEEVKVSYQKDGSQRGDLIWLVDFTSFPSSSLGMHNAILLIICHSCCMIIWMNS